MHCKLYRLVQKQWRLVVFALSSIFCFLTISTVCKKKTEISYAGGLQKIKAGSFSNPEKVKPPSSSFINIGMILIKLQKNEGSGLAEVGRTFNNIILFNSGTPLHFVILSDN